MAAIERLALQSSELARLEYDFLYDKARHYWLSATTWGAPAGLELLRPVGFGSEIPTFVAIAQGELPQESWFALDVCSLPWGRIASPFVERVDVRILMPLL